jgi:hypothetical protein
MSPDALLDVDNHVTMHIKAERTYAAIKDALDGVEDSDSFGDRFYRQLWLAAQVGESFKGGR